MATDFTFIETLHERAGLGERLTHRKMFGEYALYVDGKVVALACDNQLFLKPTAEGAALAPSAEEWPPYPGAKPHLRLDDELEDGGRLERLLLATATALPAAKPRRAAGSPARRRRGVKR